LDRERFLAEVDAEIHIDGGFFGADVRNSTGFLVEITSGTWSNARWTYSSGGTLHIVGSPPGEGTTNGPTKVHTNGFVSWNTAATPTLQFTLDDGGVAPFSIGAEGEFHPHSEPVIPGFITIEVDGFDAYLAGAGNAVGDTIDLVVCPSGLNYGEDNWTTGAVADGRGLVSLKEDGTGVELTILGGSAIPGDANDSGFVDDDDLAILLSNWEQDPGTVTTWALGDFTDDTDVDDDDLAVLLGNWTGPPPGGAAVPEPVSAVLLMIGAPLAALRRRRK